MKKIRKFCREWNLGKREIGSFIAIILTLALAYGMLILVSNIAYLYYR